MLIVAKYTGLVQPITQQLINLLSRWTSVLCEVVKGCGLGGGSGTDKGSSSISVSPSLEDSVKERDSSSSSEKLSSWSEKSSLEDTERDSGSGADWYREGYSNWKRKEY